MSSQVNNPKAVEGKPAKEVTKLQPYADIIRKWGLAALLVAAFAAAAATLITWLYPPDYKATTTVVVVPTTPGQNYNDINVNLITRSAAQLMKTHQLLDTVGHNLHLAYSADELDRKVTIVVEPESSVLAVEVQDRNPALAAQIANGVVDAYVNSEQAASSARRTDVLAQLQEQIAAQEKQLRADTQAVALLEQRGQALTPDQAAELAVDQQKQRVDANTYSDLLARYELLSNQSMGTFQLAVRERASAASATQAHQDRLTKIGLAALAGLIAVLGIAFLLSSPTSGLAIQRAPYPGRRRAA
jgi:protein tyrosine kinase EpsB modulator